MERSDFEWIAEKDLATLEEANKASRLVLSLSTGAIVFLIGFAGRTTLPAEFKFMLDMTLLSFSISVAAWLLFTQALLVLRAAIANAILSFPREPRSPIADRAASSDFVSWSVQINERLSPLRKNVWKWYWLQNWCFFAGLFAATMLYLIPKN